MLVLTEQQTQALGRDAVHSFIRRYGKGFRLTPRDLHLVELEELVPAGWHDRPMNGKPRLVVKLPNPIPPRRYWWPDAALFLLHWYDKHGELHRPMGWFVAIERNRRRRAAAPVIPGFSF